MVTVSDYLVWIDCEMTGLIVGTDELVEVAALVTDGNLNVLGDGIDVIIRPSEQALEQMNDFVRTMHTTSGLITELAHGVSVEEAERQVLDYVKAYVPEPGKAPLAGNTIGTDRMFLAAQMPTLEAHVHYRNVDVSSIKELARRWMPKAYYHSPAKSGNHRALADIQESIEELRYYREAVFVAAPGPDTATLREIAHRHQGSLTGARPQPSTVAADAEVTKDEAAG